MDRDDRGDGRSRPFDGEPNTQPDIDTEPPSELLRDSQVHELSELVMEDLPPGEEELGEMTGYEEKTDRVVIEAIRDEDLLTEPPEDLPQPPLAEPISRNVAHPTRSSTRDDLPRMPARAPESPWNMDEYQDTDHDYRPADAGPYADPQADPDPSPPFSPDTQVDSKESSRRDPTLPLVDQASERTLIFGDEAVQEQAPAARLVVIRGENEGREIALSVREISMGRGPDNDLVFPDPGCSRRHALLEFDGTDYILTDLGSGNGTVVNGSRIQRAKLADGDQISAGSTILQFINPLGPAPSAPVPVRGRTQTSISAEIAPQAKGQGPLAKMLADPRQRKLVLVGGCGVIGFLLLMLVIKLVVGSPAEISPAEAARLAEEREYLALIAERDSKLAVAKTALSSKDYGLASIAAEEALAIDPDNDLALQYKNFSDRQLESKQAAEQAEVAMHLGNLDDAQKHLQRIADDSDFVERRVELDQEVRKKRIEFLLISGKALLEEDKLEEAQKAYEDILALRPDHAEAMEGMTQVKEAMDKKKTARPTPTRVVVRKDPPPRTEPAPRKTGTELGGGMLGLYKGGKLDEAIAAARDAGADGQAKQIEEIAALYRKGMEKSREYGKPDEAIALLEKVLARDKKLAGGGGAIAQEVHETLCKIHNVVGSDAMLGKYYPKAAKAFRRSLRICPGNDRAQKGVTELEDRVAPRLYNEAYVIQTASPEQAVKNLDIVLQILQAKHEYHEKAKRLKQRIQGGAGAP